MNIVPTPGILRMGQNVPGEYMEQACEKALAANIYTHKYFERLFKKQGEPVTPPIAHQNIRGQEYYGPSLAEEASNA